MAPCVYTYLFAQLSGDRSWVHKSMFKALPENPTTKTTFKFVQNAKNHFHLGIL